MNSEQLIKLTRFNYSPNGTFGLMVLPDGIQFYTVEKEWNSNKRNVSCIPEGLYSLKMRSSPVVQRVTNNRYDKGWEVTNVVNRSFIMIHPGNWPVNFNGCIGVGQDYSILNHPRMGAMQGVTNSQKAFDSLMYKLEKFEEWFLDIRGYKANYEDAV